MAQTFLPLASILSLQYNLIQIPLFYPIGVLYPNESDNWERHETYSRSFLSSYLDPHFNWG